MKIMTEGNPCATTVGIDLAKSVFSMHEIDEQGKAAMRRTVSHGKVMEVMAGVGPVTATAIVRNGGPRHRVQETGGNLPPGWGWCHGNTRLAARPGWDEITKQGDVYLCTLLIHGTRACWRG